MIYKKPHNNDYVIYMATKELLHRLLDGKPTDQPDVNPPAALSLSKEPEANVARYDGLRIQKGTRHAS